jgi:hypothetical protein
VSDITTGVSMVTSLQCIWLSLVGITSQSRFESGQGVHANDRAWFVSDITTQVSSVITMNLDERQCAFVMTTTYDRVVAGFCIIYLVDFGLFWRKKVLYFSNMHWVCTFWRSASFFFQMGATGIFYWQNPSSHTIAMGSTNPVRETRNLSCQVKGASVWGWQLSCAECVEILEASTSRSS